MTRLPYDNPSDYSDGLIEFELTGIEEARIAHDTLPEGVEKLPELSPGYWEQRRRKPLPTDRALAGSTIDWLIMLPEPLRPKQLCERYPRAANAIAAAWNGPDRLATLDDMLFDRRGSRRGFPVAVRSEIEALRAAALAETD